MMWWCKRLKYFYSVLLLSLVSFSALSAPVANNDERQSPQGFPNTINVLSNDEYDDTSPVTVVATAPANGSVQVNTADGSIRYTPNNNFRGIDTFTYTLTDSTGTSENATVTINVVTIEFFAKRENSRSMAAVIDIMCPRLFDIPDFELSAGQILLKDQCNNLFLLAALGGDVAGALNAIANEEIPAQAQTIREFTRTQTNSVESRMHDVRAGVEGFSLLGLSLEVDGERMEGHQLQQLMSEWVGGNAGEVPVYFPRQRWSLFINGSLNQGNKGTSDLETGYDIDGLSLTFGADYRITNHWVTGVALGLNSVDVDYENGLGSTETESTNYIFYSTFYKQKFSIDTMVGLGTSTINTDRRIRYTAAGTTLDTLARGDTTGDQWFASATAYYEMAFGALGVTPFVAFDFLDSQIDGYSESNAAGLEQTIRDRSVESMVFSIGARASYAFSFAWGVLMPHCALTFEQESKDERKPAVSSFLFDPDSLVFDISLDDADTSYFEANVGASAVLPLGISLFIDYQQLFAYKNYDASQLTFGGRWEVEF